jgi:F-type H+-transporting ATPase subunit delta
MNDALSSHYARALADAVFRPESGISPEEAVKQMRTASDFINASPELHRVIMSPAVPRNKKAALVGKLITGFGLNRLVQNFLMVVVEHRRINELPSIADGFELAVDERLGFERAEIVSATELTETQKQELLQALEKSAGKKIRPVYKIDGTILGGVVARLGSKEYDGSILGRLEAMRQRLSAAS